MYKKVLRFASIVVLSLVFLFTSNVSAAEIVNTSSIKRLWGNDRYQTCSSIVADGWTSSNYAVIVNGENFPDALSASVLAKKYNAPILLTKTASLDDNARNQLTRLKVKKAFIVGGTGVISDIIPDNLSKMGISVERFYGNDRYATSIAVANQIGTKNGIILTTGSDYTDALSVAPIAAKLQIPIILMTKDSIPSSISNFISGKSISKTYVLGGQDLISDAVVSKFSNIKRIPGADKYERNINIIKAFEDKFNFSKVCLAYSEGFADALSGSAFAAINGNPIILVGDMPLSVTKSFISSKGIKQNNLIIFGGTAGITDSAFYSLLNTSTDTSNIGTATISNNVVEIDKDKSENIQSHIVSKTQNENNNQVITLDSSNTSLSNLKSGDIFFMDPTKESPLGFAGKIISNNTTSDGKNVLEITQPQIDELLSEANFSIQKRLEKQDLISSTFPEGTTINFIKSNLTASLNNSLLADTQTGDVKITIPNSKFSYKSLGISASQVIVLKSPKITTALELKKTLGVPTSIKKLEAELNTTIEYENKVEINGSESIEGSELSKFLGLDTSNEIKMGNASMSGVNMDDKIILGSMTYQLGTVPVLTYGNIYKKIPIGATIFMYLTFDGKIEAAINIDAKESCYFDRGISLNGITANNEVLDKSKNSLTINGNLNGDLKCGVGAGLGVIAMGIIPADVTVNLVSELSGNLSGNFDLINKKYDGPIELDSSLKLSSLGNYEIELEDGKWSTGKSAEIKFLDKLLFEEKLSDNKIIIFPDKELESAVRNAINKSTGDILKSDVSKLTELDTLQFRHLIVDITGIENLTNLTHLWLDDNKLSNVDALKGLTNLTYLNLGSNQISNIDGLSGLTNLTELYLGYNKISNIDALKGLTNLKKLGLNNNQINNIDTLSGLTNLEYLDLHDNQISDTDINTLKSKLPNCVIWH